MKTTKCILFALFCAIAQGTWANPTNTLGDNQSWLQEGDTWDASTKTLTVNNNPWENAYSDNTEIQHLIFADNVTNIGKAAFDACGNLESVTFAENSQLETINGWAFGYCGKLTTITIPASVITLNGPVFTGSGLQTIFFEEGSRLQTIG
ncbi:MAG: leucine-rich repeat protein, partial [Bacteroidaceae bacterium]|nr:leucine-rich repeat protein [Bacteroidaceae bacterium]